MAKILLYKDKHTGEFYTYSRADEEYSAIAKVSGREIHEFEKWVVDSNDIPAGINLGTDVTIIDNKPIFDKVAALSRIGKHLLDEEASSKFSTGFQYNGVTFSLSNNAQSKWNSFFTARNSLPYPFSVADIQNENFVTISNASDIVAIHAASSNRISEILSENTIAKQTIAAMSSSGGIISYLSNNLTDARKTLFMKYVVKNEN